MRRLQQLAVEQGGPSIERLGGADALPTCSDPSATSSRRALPGWARFSRALWSGGQALLGIFSLLVVTPGRRVLHARRLGPDGRDGRLLDAPTQHRDTIRAIARDIDRRHRGLRARAGARLPHPRHVLRGRADADRPEFRRHDRHDVGHPELHPLCGLADRADPLDGRRHRAVLAGLDDDRRDARRSSCSGSSSRAISCRRSSSANVSVCTRSGSCSRCWLSGRCSASSGCSWPCRSRRPRRHRALRASPISDEPALSRRRIRPIITPEVDIDA